MNISNRLLKATKQVLSNILFIFSFNTFSRGENIIKYKRSIHYKSKIKVLGNNNRIILDNNSTFYKCYFFIKGNNNTITIGNDCKFKNTEFWIEDNYNTLKISANTTCKGAHIALTENNKTISIGEDCMFSSGIDIRNGDSHAIYNLDTEQRINHAQDIYIGKHVWLGKGCQILKDVNIGDNSIIASKSIVTSNIPPNTIAGGIPAKIIKEQIAWTRSRS